MAWNEPGGKKNEHDPWSGKDKSNTPPDLDKIFNSFQKKMSKVFSGGNGNGNGGGKGLNPRPDKSSMFLGLLALAGLVIIWALFGFFIVRPAEEAVILRFGKYVETVEPGLHWVPPIIEAQYRVNEQQVDSYSYSSEMLTEDENIVSVSIAVQYRRADAEAYLFNVVNPVWSLQQATASALRQVIGNTTLNAILTSGRTDVEQQVRAQIETLVTKYETGLEVTDVVLQPAKPPAAVESAFDDAIKAQEDEERYKNIAEAYSKQVIPEAKGQAKRILAEAEAYQQQVVLNSEGETARFIALLPEYHKSKRVTRERLYLSVLEAVLENTSKVYVATKGQNNLVYFPTDKKTLSASGNQSPSTLTSKQNQIDDILSPMVRQSVLQSTVTPATSAATTSSGSSSSYLSIANQGRYSAKGGE